MYNDYAFLGRVTWKIQKIIKEKNVHKFIDYHLGLFLFISTFFFYSNWDHLSFKCGVCMCVLFFFFLTFYQKHFHVFHMVFSMHFKWPCAQLTERMPFVHTVIPVPDHVEPGCPDSSTPRPLLPSPRPLCLHFLLAFCLH